MFLWRRNQIFHLQGYKILLILFSCCYIESFSNDGTCKCLQTDSKIEDLYLSCIAVKNISPKLKSCCSSSFFKVLGFFLFFSRNFHKTCKLTHILESETFIEQFMLRILTRVGEKCFSRVGCLTAVHRAMTIGISCYPGIRWNYELLHFWQLMQ